MLKDFTKKENILIFILILIIDQVIKWFFVIKETAFCVKFMCFQKTLNPGITMGFLSDNVFLANTVFFAIMCLCFFIVVKNKEFFMANIFGTICVFAGSISNAIDKFFHLAVIDPIGLPLNIFYKSSPYFIFFNIADCFIVFGIIILSVKFMRHRFFAK